MISKKLHGGARRADDVSASGPLIAPGVDTIDATAMTMETLGLAHSHNGEDKHPLLADIGRFIRSGTRPPDERLPLLERMRNDKGVYWPYPR
jgi:hypothetical protein